MEKTENRGGWRKGAGRKPIFELSEKKRREIMRDVDLQAKKNGTSLGLELGKMMFAPNAEKRMKMSSIQTYLRDLLLKSSERDLTVTGYKVPQIFLPEKYPDSDEAPDFKPREAQATPFKKKSND